MSARPVYAVGNVFVPGGLPTVTYNARAALRLEEQVREYLDAPHSILSVSGPTKTGKTTLIHHIVHAGLFISGGSIETFENFLEVILDELEIPMSTEDTTAMEDGAAEGESLTGKIPSVVDAQFRSDRSAKDISSHKDTRVRSPRIAARQALTESARPLVIDDFHYIKSDVQLQIVRYVKDMVFQGHAVILISVPHRAYDAVRVEKEMTGRVQVLEVGFWSNEDLELILNSGFSALNLEPADTEFKQRLIAESFRSPHLMQEFCRGLCRDAGVFQTLEHAAEVTQPKDGWDSFFRKRASSSSKAAFDRLARGPRQRSDRRVRTMKDGRTFDIYGATLVAIGHTGPLTSLTYEQLRAAFREVLQSEVPQRHEITRILEEMSKIAREQIDGEPVVDYIEDISTLYISDPFFAYYLRWGSQEIAELSTDDS